jgi:hypothetical protein
MAATASMAATLSERLGITVRHRQVPLEDLAQRSEDLAAMYAFLSDTGYHVDIPALRATHPNVGWHMFARWAQRQRWA